MLLIAWSVKQKALPSSFLLDVADCLECETKGTTLSFLPDVVDCPECEAKRHYATLSFLPDVADCLECETEGTTRPSVFYQMLLIAWSVKQKALRDPQMFSQML